MATWMMTSVNTTDHIKAIFDTYYKALMIDAIQYENERDVW